MSHCIIAVPHLLVTALYSFSIVFWSDQALDFPADKFDKRFHARAFRNPQQFPVGKKDLPVISPVDEEGTRQVDCQVAQIKAQLRRSFLDHIRVVSRHRSLPGHFHGIEGHVSLVQEFFPACHLVRVSGETQGDRIKYGIEPVITLSHFEMPFNLAKNYGGFTNRKTIDFFVRFAEVCFKRYKDKVKYWMTFNEIDNQSAFNNDFLMATNSGILFKEGMTDEEKEATMYQAANYEFVASALAVKIGHKINPDFKIGLMINYSPVRPLTPSSEDTLLADKFEQHRDFFSDVQVFSEYPKAIEAYIEKHGYRTDITDEDRVVLKEGTVDYVAFSYYQSTTVSSEKVSADELSDLEKAVAG